MAGAKKGGREESEATAVGSGGRVMPGCEEGREADTRKGSEGRGGRQEDCDNDEEDFFFPVTPEQLIALNLAEMAAGKMKSYSLSFLPAC